MASEVDKPVAPSGSSAELELHEHRSGSCGPECKERPPAERWVALTGPREDTEEFDPGRVAGEDDEQD